MQKDVINQLVLSMLVRVLSMKRCPEEYKKFMDKYTETIDTPYGKLIKYKHPLLTKEE